MRLARAGRARRCPSGRPCGTPARSWYRKCAASPQAPAPDKHRPSSPGSAPPLGSALAHPTGVLSRSIAPAAVKLTSSASSASRNKRGTPAAPFAPGLASGRPVSGRAALICPWGRALGDRRHQQQQGAIAQTGQVARTAGRDADQAGRGGHRVRLAAGCRPGGGPQCLAARRVELGRRQADLSMHGADRSATPAERAAAEPRCGGEQVGGQGLGRGRQRGPKLRPAPGDEGRPFSSVKFAGRRRRFGDGFCR